MSTDSKIMIGIAAVQLAIAIVTLVMGWRMSNKQIQIMLEQSQPKEKKPKTGILWGVYLNIIAHVLTLLFVACAVLYHFIYIPLSTRWNTFILLVNVIGGYWNFKHLRKYLKLPRRKIIES
jgi:ABC-type Fe3+ transport system permease subunit